MGSETEALRQELKLADERAKIWRDRSDLVASKLTRAEFRINDAEDLLDRILEYFQMRGNTDAGGLATEIKQHFQKVNNREGSDDNS